MSPSPSRKPSPEEQHPAPNMPPLSVDPAAVNSVLFVLERGSYGSAIPSILAAAATYRAIALERGGEPFLNVVSEAQLVNWANRHTKIGFLESLRPAETTLFLCSSGLARRDYAAVAGMYQACDAILVGKPELIDDSIPLGKRPDVRRSLVPAVQAVMGPRADNIVHELLALADGTEPEAQELLAELKKSLSALQVRTGLLARLGDSKVADPLLAIEKLIVDLAAGSRSPALLSEYGTDYADAYEVAQSIWDEARELAPGVFEVCGAPQKERDHLVRNCLGEIYGADPRARFVLERHDDAAPTALKPDEASDLSLRLKLGQPAQGLLDEVQEILSKRRDHATSMHIELLKARHRDALAILKPLLERAQYRPDPDGVLTMLKSPLDFSLSTLVERNGFEVVEHNTLWIVDVQTGRQSPMAITFQASQLERFLRCVS